MVSIIISTLSRAFICPPDILAPEYEAMNDQGTHCCVGHEKRECERSSDSRQAIFKKGGLVEDTTGENFRQGVSGAFVCKQSRRHEWE